LEFKTIPFCSNLGQKNVKIKYLFVLTSQGFFGGYPTFFISIASIGIVTAVIGDIASHLGCFIELKVSISATFE